MVHSLRSEDGDEVYEGDGLAEHINQYFAGIGKKLADSIIEKGGNNLGEGLCLGPPNANSDDICNRLVTENEIESVLKNIKVDKSSAIQNLRSMVIIHAFYSQINRVMKMYNGSLTLCTFPMKWKRALVVPLPKISNPKTASDMRPISLLPLPG